MNQIRGQGDDIINNSFYHKIRDIFGYISSFHYKPGNYLKKTIEKWFSEIENELKKRRLYASYNFIKWLVEDLNNGSAFE